MNVHVRTIINACIFIAAIIALCGSAAAFIDGIILGNDLSTLKGGIAGILGALLISFIWEDLKKDAFGDSHEE